LLYLRQTAYEEDFSIWLHTQLAPGSAQAARVALEAVLRRKGRALDAMSDSIAALKRHASPEDQRLLDQLSSARAELSALTLRGPGSDGIEPHQAALRTLQDQVEQLEAQVGSRSAQFRSESAAVTLDTVRAAIPQDARLVEFVAFTPFHPKS